MEVTLLSNILKNEDGENQFGLLSEDFVCKNKDVEAFLKKKAAQSSKLYTSATYLISEITDRVDLVGYFTLATKMLIIRQENLSRQQSRIIKRFVSSDVEDHTFELPAILLAQFGRNFSQNSISISGKELMKIALERIEIAISLTSGKVVFLECEPYPKLIAFYEGCGFKCLDNHVVSKDKKQLIQMFRII